MPSLGMVSYGPIGLYLAKGNAKFRHMVSYGPISLYIAKGNAKFRHMVSYGPIGLYLAKGNAKFRHGKLWTHRLIYSQGQYQV